MLLARGAVVAVPRVNPAVVLGAVSALCTAVACGLGAALVARWTGSAAAGAAAGIVAGAASSVWLNATEAEVYSASLLLSVSALWLADRVGRAAEGGRPAALAAYLLALAAPLHLSALVVAPGVAALAYGDGTPRRRGLALLLVAVAVLTAGAATGSIPIAVVGAAGVAALAATRTVRWSVALGALALVAVALSALAVLVVRARHDPAINQGNPASWPALVAVVGRRQYEQIGMWPRNAPVWLQLANLLEYADWQFALALGRGPQFSAPRTLGTALYAWLAVAGASRHRQADRASWRAMLLLLAAASVGVVVYLNFRAGPSIGWGILPDSAPHEARERDYFFALAFWLWGLWAGVGAVTVAERTARLGVRGRGALAAGLVALPLALNAPAVTRRGEPERAIPRAVAATLLTAAPPNAVLLLGGDNDSYPVWFLQQALGDRRDVTPVTIPLLPAGWYRAELARRAGLLAAADTLTARWRGEAATLEAIARRATAAGRPVVVAATVEEARRRAIERGTGGAWTSDGIVYVARPAGSPAGVRVDSAAAVALARRLAPVTAVTPGVHADPAVRYMAQLLRCPAAVSGLSRGPAADSLLATRCRGR